VKSVDIHCCLSADFADFADGGSSRGAAPRDFEIREIKKSGRHCEERQRRSNPSAAAHRLPHGLPRPFGARNDDTSDVSNFWFRTPGKRASEQVKASRLTPERLYLYRA
jgi:hypothetical protein